MSKKRKKKSSNREKTKRNYKDGIFRGAFNDKSALLELYNALSGSDLSDEDEIQIVTLTNTIFDGIKNDLAFLVGEKLIYLTEQQSTISENYPLRLFCYAAREYERLYISKDVYKRKRIDIPAPELYVFYNGKEDYPLETEMKLSDSYKAETDTIFIEAIVKIININYDKGADILKKSKTMRDYSYFVHLVHTKYEASHDQDWAIEEAVRECIEKDILANYLIENRGDIMGILEVVLTDEEREQIRQEEADERAMEKAMPLAMEKANIKLAQKLKQAGMPVHEIAEYMELELKQVEAL